MSNVQTQRLNNITGTLLKGSGKIFKAVLCEELAAFFKRLNVVDTKKHIVSCDVGSVAVFFYHGIDNLLTRRGFIHCDYVVSDIVHRMHRAGAGV